MSFLFKKINNVKGSMNCNHTTSKQTISRKYVLGAKGLTPSWMGYCLVGKKNKLNVNKITKAKGYRK